MSAPGSNPVKLGMSLDQISWTTHQAEPAAGSVNWKTVPPAALGEAQMRPRCDSMIDRQIASPIPVPFALVVKNASKICSLSFAPSPGPESSIHTSTPSGLQNSDPAQAALLTSASATDATVTGLCK